MERLQVREISRLLAQKKHISIGDAERFVTEMFSTVSIGLKDDKQVIINGLGTFRLTTILERESVGFTPDTELAENVNSPFSNFKTVEITGQLSAEDLAEISNNVLSEIEAYEEAESEDSSVDDSQKDASDILGKEAETDGIDATEGDASRNEAEAEQAVEQQVEALTERVEALTETIENRRKSRKILWISIVAILLISMIGGGTYYGVTERNKKLEQERIAAQKAAELKQKQDSIDNVKRMVNAVDLTDEQKLFLIGKGLDGAPEYPCSTDLETAKKILPHGGYKIVGTLKTVEVKQGESLSDIATANGLGQGEIYIQVHNALENVKEGQKIRIPMLELK